MYRFSQWLETANLSQTHISSNSNNQTDKSILTTNSTNSSKNQVDFDSSISDAIESLKNIHKRLTSIFATIKQRHTTFDSPELQLAFKREMLTGIDSVGRAHAILTPVGVSR